MADMMELAKKIGGGSPTRAAVYVGIAAMALAAIVVLFMWNQGVDYQVLYSQLSSEDSGAVIEKLKAKRIPYKVDGLTISVPSDKVYETRMELAGEGLPQGGGIGYEIFDKTSFGVTEFVQKINYKRALQGELARTIMQIKEIEAARVHLALPEKGVFLDEQKKSRSSIIVKLRPGKALTPGQVNSIVHLVSNSSENLRPEDVTVVDTSGKMWTNTPDDNDLRLSASQLEYKKSFEKDMEGRIQSMLEKTVGTNKAVARVSVDIDTRHIERTEETYDPESQVKRSEQRNVEKTIGSSPASGVPGVMSNLPDINQRQSLPAGSPAQSQRQDEVVNYEINKVVSRISEPTGSIKRLTVSVLVDGTYETTKGADGKDVKKFVPRTEDEIAKFTSMVKNAVGFSAQRGDSITLVSTPLGADFTEPPLEKEKAPLIPVSMIPSLVKYLSMVLIAIVLIIFILRPLTKKILEEKTSVTVQEQGGIGIGAGGVAREGVSRLSIEEEEELPLGDPRADRSLARLKKLIKENPQQVAMILKGWIRDDGNG